MSSNEHSPTNINIQTRIEYYWSDGCPHTHT